MTNLSPIETGSARTRLALGGSSLQRVGDVDGEDPGRVVGQVVALLVDGGAVVHRALLEHPAESYRFCLRHLVPASAKIPIQK